MIGARSLCLEFGIVIHFAESGIYTHVGKFNNKQLVGFGIKNSITTDL